MKHKMLYFATSIFLFVSFYAYSQSGNVGIGVENPAVRFHVDSTVLFTGSVNFNPASFPNLSEGPKMFWYPIKSSFRVGYLVDDEWDYSQIGYTSVGMGVKVTASGNNSISLGRYSTSSGFSSVSIGNNAMATVDNSTAIGYFATSTGEKSIALGNFAAASGENAVAIGSSNSAEGLSSISMGSSTTAHGNFSTAMGQGTNAFGRSSTVMGHHTNANGFASTVVGIYNDPIVAEETSITSTTPLFIVGSGNNSIERKNAMVVRKDGRVGIGTSAPDRGVTIFDPQEIGSAFVNIKDDKRELLIGVNSSGGSFRTMTDHDLSFWTNSKRRVDIDNNGNVGIGTTTPSALLEVNAITVKKVNGGLWSSTSDRRLKKNIRPYQDGLSQILKINPVIFNYNSLSGYDTAIEHIGVIAQEINEVTPYMVSGFNLDNEEYLQVDNSAMIFMLINSIKELSSENKSLKKELENSNMKWLEQEKRLSHLENLINVKLK